MFGESRSESPRLPSPWQQAIATSKVVPLTSPSPLTLTRRSSRKASQESSLINTTHTSTRSATAIHDSQGSSSGRVINQGEDAVRNSSDTGDRFSKAPRDGEEQLARSIVSSSHGSQSSLASSSFTYDPDMHSRLWSPRISESLVISNSSLTKLAAESDHVGHIEYKLKLVLPNNSSDRFERLTTQLKWRLSEGGGEAMYEIGVLDDGTLIGISTEEMEQSLRTLELMASELGATVMVLKTIQLTGPPPAHVKYSAPIDVVTASSASSPSKVESIDDGNADPDDSRRAILTPGQRRRRAAAERKRREKVERKRARKEKAQTEMQQQTVAGPSSIPFSSATFQRSSNAKDRKKWAEPNYDSEPDNPDEPSQNNQSDGLTCGRQDTTLSVSRDRHSDDESPFAESWKERNLQKAREEERRRQQNQKSEALYGNHVHLAGTTLQERRKIRRQWKRRRKLEMDSGSPPHAFLMGGDQPDIFDLDIDVGEHQIPPDRLTSAALSILESAHECLPTSENGSDPSIAPESGVISRRALRVGERRRQRLEARHQSLLQGDHLNDPMTPFLGASDSDDDGSDDRGEDVHAFVMRNAGFTSPTAVSGARTVTAMQPEIAELGSPAKTSASFWVSTSPTYTLKASSPTNRSIFSLGRGLPANDASSTPPSPSTTIALPLDNLSLSFSRAEVCPDPQSLNNSSSDPENTAAIDSSASNTVRVCVEAIVIKKRDVDDQFGFLDFGGWTE